MIGTGGSRPLWPFGPRGPYGLLGHKDLPAVAAMIRQDNSRLKRRKVTALRFK